MLHQILSLSLLACVVMADEPDTTDSSFQFVTRPDIEAPKWDIEIYDESQLQQDHYWFVAPYENIHQENFPLWNGPHIYDTNGQLIWSGASYVEYINTMDFRMSEVDGQRMLSYIWNKDSRDQKAGGNGILLNDSYELHAIVDMVGNSSKWNFHELNLIDGGKRALMALSQDFSATQINVPPYNGSCRIAKQGFKEVDVETGRIFFEWHTLGRISPEESVYVGDNIQNNTWKEKCANNWDISHINAVDKFDDGDYLISARHTDTIYKVSHRDHSIIWRLGGRWNDFVLLDHRVKFGQQHHARVRSQNETHTILSLFDNAAGGGSVENLSGFESWGLIVALRTDVTPMTADLVARFEKPFVKEAREYTKSRGSLDILPNGNIFMGWVLKSHIAEYTPEGRLLMTAMLKNDAAASYRSYKMPWAGRPSSPPDVVAIARERDGVLSTIVHVSWNGATEVATWNLLRSDRFGDVSTLIASSLRQGFETRLIVGSFAEHVIVVALNKRGEEIGRSGVTAVSMPSKLRTPSLAHQEEMWLSNHSVAQWTAQPSHTMIWEGPKWVVVGFAICGLLCCIGISLWSCSRISRKTSWWGARTSQQKWVGYSEEIGSEQQTWMLEDDEEYQTDEEEEKVEEMVELDPMGPNSRHCST